MSAGEVIILQKKETKNQRTHKKTRVILEDPRANVSEINHSIYLITPQDLQDCSWGIIMADIID